MAQKNSNIDVFFIKSWLEINNIFTLIPKYLV